MSYSIQEFVKDALAAGRTRAEIREALEQGGWREDEIANALDAFADTPFSVPVPKRKPYLSAQEAFMYLLLFMTLYVSAIALGTLFFQFINGWFPDPLAYGMQTRSAYAIRQATASLVIAYPVFLGLSIALRKAVIRDPEKRASKIRKWLTYITLFIASGVIIGDLISLVYNFLNGDLTVRFVLKVLTIALIAGAIFGYYLWELREDERMKKNDTRRAPRRAPISV